MTAKVHSMQQLLSHVLPGFVEGLLPYTLKAWYIFISAIAFINDS